MSDSNFTQLVKEVTDLVDKMAELLGEAFNFTKTKKKLANP